jgi:hypothetical protein
MLTKIQRSLNIATLLAIGIALTIGFSVKWPLLRDAVKEGLSAKSSAVTPPEERIPVANPLTGVEVMLPAGYELGCGRGGIVVRKEEDNESVLVAALHADRPITSASALSEVHRAWDSGLTRMGNRAQLGVVHDEGATARAALDLELSGEKFGGEVRVWREGPGFRLEAFWCPKDQFDRQRAELELVGRCVTLRSPRPLPSRPSRKRVIPRSFRLSRQSFLIRTPAYAPTRRKRSAASPTFSRETSSWTF